MSGRLLLRVASLRWLIVVKMAQFNDGREENCDGVRQGVFVFPVSVVPESVHFSSLYYYFQDVVRC
jgi:hypothetical protein